MQEQFTMIDLGRSAQTTAPITALTPESEAELRSEPVPCSTSASTPVVPARSGNSVPVSSTSSDYASLTEARKELSTKEIRGLIQAAERIAGDFRRKESELIDILQRLDRTKAYRASGFNSLYSFCVEVLKLSEGQSYHYIAIAKKCEQVPELAQAVFTKQITASKARRLCSVLSPDNKDEWLRLAASCTHRELEKAVRAKDPKAHVPDEARYVTETHLALKLTLSKESFAKLQRVLELMRSASGRAVSYEEALLAMAEVYLEKKDPMKKAERARLRAVKKEKKMDRISAKAGGETNLDEIPGRRNREKNRKKNRSGDQSEAVGTDESALGAAYLGGDEDCVEDQGGNKLESECAGETVQVNQDQRGTSQGAVEHFAIAKSGEESRKPSGSRKAIAAKVRHAVWVRDNGRCQYVHNGKTCNARTFLEHHHIQPVSLGGKDEVDNLVLLCASHHQHLHGR